MAFLYNLFMSYINKVEKENNVVFNILKNAFNDKKISHAYLFSAPHNQEIINEPMMLIELLINDNPFNESLRSIDAYSDLTILDGSSSMIKKDDVVEAANKLQEKPLDAKGVKILFIKNVENANVQSVNSLLKFIEEPTKDTFIIMTTNNLSDVLTTIRSRSQVVNLKKLNKATISKNLVESGVPSDMSVLVSAITNSFDDGKELYASKEFKEAFKSFVVIMKKAIKSKSEIIIGLKSLMNKTNYKLIMSLLNEFVNDIWRYESGIMTSFKSEEELLKDYSTFDFKKALPLINDFIVSHKFNVNFELYKTKFVIELEECYV